MMSLFSEDRRTRLGQQAATARSRSINRQLALLVAIFYNCVGLADIWSTHLAIASGVGEEANPFIRAAMDDLSWEKAWITIKLMLQFVATAMVLWFPNRWVMAIVFGVSVFMGAVVHSNLAIAGLV
ncbi:MAG: DUF5658 family protein [Pseudomonadota bacterium]